MAVIMSVGMSVCLTHAGIYQNKAISDHNLGIEEPTSRSDATALGNTCCDIDESRLSAIDSTMRLAIEEIDQRIKSVNQSTSLY